MSDRRASTGPAARRRLGWALFSLVSAAALGAGVLAAGTAGGTTTAVVVLVGGLVAIGIAALLVSALVSPLPDQHGNGSALPGAPGGEGGSFGGSGYRGAVAVGGGGGN